jgi:acetylornithine deacetylase
LKPIAARVQADGGKVELEWMSAGYGVVDLDHDIEGFEAITVNYGTDVPNLSGDHKKYLYGPGSILVAHSDHEHLKVTELEKAVVDYKTLILAILEKDGEER